MLDLKTAAEHANLSAVESHSLRSWLLEQLVAQVYAKLEQGGHTRHQIPLRNVFVDLPVNNYQSNYVGQDRENFLARLLNSSPLDLRKDLVKNNRKATKRHSISDLPDDSIFSTNLLIGGPGQGKSTLSQLAAQVHRAALLIDQVNELTLSQRNIVESFIPTEQETALWPSKPLVPLQVTLPELSSWLASEKDNSDNVRKYPAILNFIQSLPSATIHKFDVAT
jgi:hypothetical protein